MRSPVGVEGGHATPARGHPCTGEEEAGGPVEASAGANCAGLEECLLRRDVQVEVDPGEGLGDRVEDAGVELGVVLAQPEE